MSVHFGTRFLVILLVRALEEYARHIASIALDLSPEQQEWLDTGLTLLKAFQDLNEPGPG